MVKETKGVAWLCKKLGKCFLHYSTDYVCQSLSYCVASDYEKQKIKECYKNPHQKCNCKIHHTYYLALVNILLFLFL